MNRTTKIRSRFFSRREREEFLMKFSSGEDEIIGKLSKNAQMKSHVTGNAKEILDKWMYDHRFYCYPTKYEKQQLAQKTNLSMQKITNWFINSRRRVLPKLLEDEGVNATNFTISRRKRSKNEDVTAEGFPIGGKDVDDILNATAHESDGRKANKVIGELSNKTKVIAGYLQDLSSENKILYLIVTK